MKVKKTTRKCCMQKILNDYMAEHGQGPHCPIDVYMWAMKKNLWQPTPKTQKQLFCEELGRAAREETYQDAQGREVRRKHAVVIKKKGSQQLVLWADITDAPEGHMRLSFQQRRRSIGSDVRQLKTDMDSYNDNNKRGASIQLSFNFDEDLAEEAHSGEYDDTPPEDAVADNQSE